ncbi:unnamed protein product [Nesidiocoris tenuis]|uniref:Uncharacterized protein n=1 Tax=Nesidiocoris tenuis TaxID=355587 RepID=A0A6H5GE17_9HEMI|nr:unnamed protein product [Nesidiocoris tenuis]
MSASVVSLCQAWIRLKNVVGATCPDHVFEGRTTNLAALQKTRRFSPYFPKPFMKQQNHSSQEMIYCPMECNLT